MNLPGCGRSFYDISWIDGPFDSDLSADVVDNAEEYCDYTDSGNVDWSNTCLKKGIRWSVAYKLGFTVCLLYSLSVALLILGAYQL